MAPVYNTIPQADDEPLVQTKAAPTSIKKLIFTAAAASFVLGACAATVVAPKSAIGTYQFAAGSNGGCPPAGSTTEEDCKAAGCTWAPGVYPADVTTNGGICVPTCVEIKILRRVRAESSRRPPRHRRDACSMVWRCRFLAARSGQHGRIIAEK